MLILTGKGLLAHLTLFAANGMRIVNMEAFEDFTTAVDCNDDDGKMSLTFKPEAYATALKVWSTINSNDSDKFLLIANHPGCGPDNDDRQPYIVTHVSEDKKHFTTLLDAQPAPWADVAHTYELYIGTSNPTTTPRTSKRGAQQADFKLPGDGDYSEPWTVPIKIGTPGTAVNIYQDDVFGLNCNSCYLQGNLSLSAQISVENFVPKELSFSGSPQSLVGGLDMEATVTASTTSIPRSTEKPILSGGIPDAGLTIGSLVKLGASYGYSIGFDASLQGSADILFGLDFAVPDNASLVVAPLGSTSSSASGWEPLILPHFQVKNIQADLSVGLYAKPSLLFGIDIGKAAHLDVGLDLSIPQVNATLSAKYNPQGVCPNDDTHSKTGVDFDLTADITVDATAQADILGHNLPGFPWNQNLLQKDFQLSEVCVPVDIPGLGGNTTTAATAHHSPVVRAKRY